MNSPNETDRNLLESLLYDYGQQHVLNFWSELDVASQQRLKNQIEGIDWDRLNRLIQGDDRQVDWSAMAGNATPPQAITLAEFHDKSLFAKAWDRGERALRENSVAFVLTAGGQGSRLGFELPKGLYPIGPVSHRSLFQIMLEHVQARAKQFSTTIPVYLMTSPQTDDETRRYLEANQRFGYSADDLHVFCQGTMPAIDAATGRVLLAEKGQIALSPDGHGGMLQALFNSGALENMRARGVQTLFYGQIDNPLLQICHPALIGFHLLQESEMTTQVVRKNDALQRVGNVVVVDGQTIIIEYSDLPEEAARQVNEQGELKLWAGSIAVHVIERSFLERVGAAGEGLPFHRAHKKVAHVDGTGELQNPQENNGIKFERFIFDLLPMAKRALVCEVDPNEGFAALKNSPPAKTETAEWVQQAICALHKRWIREAGGYVAAEAQVEISPFFAVDGRQLAERGAQDIRIESDTYLR